MFTLKFRLTRDRVIIAACVLITAIALLWHSLSLGGVSPRGDSREARVTFLNSLGYSVLSKSETHKTITLPFEFDHVYDSYNQLQKTADFDLSSFRGCEADMYTYNLTEFETLKEASVSLIVYRNKIIGGDVSSLEKGGVCMPLISAESNLKRLKDK